MADHEILLQFVDNDAVSYLDRLGDAAQNAHVKLKSGQEDYINILKDATAKTESLTESNQKLEDVSKKASKAVDEQKKKTDELGKSIDFAANQVNVMGVNLGSVVGRLKSWQGAIKGATAATSGWTKAIRLLMTTGVGLLITAIATLITYFTRSQRGMDKLNVAFSAVSAAIDTVIQRVVKFGEGLAKIISGRWKEGVDDIRASFKGLGDEIRETAQAAMELERRDQNLTKMRRQLTIDTARLNKEIRQLREESREEGKTTEERIKLVEEASRKENQLAEMRQRIAKEELEILQGRIAIGETMNEDLDREAELIAELDNIESQRSQRNRRLISELRGLRKAANDEAQKANKQRLKQLEEEEKRLEELKNRYSELARSIADEMHALEREFMTPSELIADDERIALESIEKLFEETARAYKEAYGEELDTTEQMEEAKMLVRRKYAEQRRKLEEGMAKEVWEAERKALKEIVDDTDDILSELDELIELESFLPENFVQRIQQTLKEAYNLDDQDIASITNSIGAIFGSFSDAFGSNVQRQLDENQRLLDAIRERRDEAAAALDDEIENMEAGYASDIESRESYYNSILEQEQRLESERAQLLERQRRQQIAQESAQQVAAIGTAVANFLSSGAKFGPVVGLALAATAISGMFAIIRAAKSQAQETTRMYKGGSLDLDSGFVNKHGSNDQYGKGYRIEGTGKVIGGNEFLIRQRIALRDQEFLNAYNQGRLDWIDLNQLARGNFDQFERVTSIVPDVSRQSGVLASNRISMREEVRNALIDVMPSLFEKSVFEVTGSINRRKEYFAKDGDIFEYSQGKLKRIRNFD